ncbi:unnamed protein product [Fusarium graminearum]|nr:unnamed protein product [Fusarium graminearum]
MTGLDRRVIDGCWLFVTVAAAVSQEKKQGKLSAAVTPVPQDRLCLFPLTSLLAVRTVTRCMKPPPPRKRARLVCLALVRGWHKIIGSYYLPQRQDQDREMRKDATLGRVTGRSCG